MVNNNNTSLSMAPPTVHYTYGNAPSYFNNNVLDNDDEYGQVAALLHKEFLFPLHSDYLKRLSYNNADAEARHRAVSWILKVNKYHCFSAETALLAVNYLDRFMSCTKTLEQDKREWAMQLASVACLSLAAKMEETHVPLLLDLQVEGAEYVFEPGTVQRMELILLGALKWRMITVTPLSYILHHGTRILGLQHKQLCTSFILRCSEVALCAVKDTGILGFRPSVVAAAVMLCTLRKTEALKNVECSAESRLLSGLKVDKVVVEECYRLLLKSFHGQSITLKRKVCNSSSLLQQGGRSPHGVLDASFSCCNSDNSIPNYATTGPSLEASESKKRRRIEDFFPTHSSVEKAY